MNEGWNDTSLLHQHITMFTVSSANSSCIGATIDQMITSNDEPTENKLWRFQGPNIFWSKVYIKYAMYRGKLTIILITKMSTQAKDNKLNAHQMSNTSINTKRYVKSAFSDESIMIVFQNKSQN